MNNRISEFFGSVWMTTFMFMYFGSLPLAFIFGDKLDVLLSIFVPTYGFWVMVGSLL